MDQAVAVEVVGQNWIGTWLNSVKMIPKSLTFLLVGRGCQLDYPYCLDWLMMCSPSKYPLSLVNLPSAQMGIY